MCYFATNPVMKGSKPKENKKPPMPGNGKKGC